MLAHLSYSFVCLEREELARGKRVVRRSEH